jgi:NhaA family Na+:H+ antiporter
MFERFFRSEAASGVLLLGTTLAALALANADMSAPLYFRTLDIHLGGLNVLHWINDGLMALFFLLVGLEIKQELVSGALSTWSNRALPGFAALGGMIVPALIYAAFNRDNPAAQHGWAIPTATDIAFSLGVLAMLGSRVPASLKIFLAALAIIDDLLAVLIIALFYGSGLSWLFLGFAAVTILFLIALNALKVTRLSPYLLLGALLWFFVLRSGLHATLAGVALAFVIPGGPGQKLEHGLANWVAFAIVPIFALANAGVSFQGMHLATLAEPVTLGVAAGLVLGKPLGVSGAVWLALRLRLGRLPENASWRHVHGVSMLCGIGFTISLFIGALAFARADLQAEAKLGVLAGSFVSGLMGWLILGLAGRAALSSGK